MTQMTQAAFSDKFRFLASVCSKQKPNDDTCAFFYSRVKNLDESSIQAAFAFFAADSHWPTANEFCLQCGSSGGSYKAIGEDWERGDPRWDDLCYRLICTKRGSTLDAQEAALGATVEIHGARGDYYAVREHEGGKKDTWERQVFGKPRSLEKPKQENKFKPPSVDYKLRSAGETGEEST
jgi:hypothetical protein